MSNDDSTKYIAIPVERYNQLLKRENSFFLISREYKLLKDDHISLMRAYDSLHIASSSNINLVKNQSGEIEYWKNKFFGSQELHDKEKNIWQSKENNLLNQNQKLQRENISIKTSMGFKRTRGRRAENLLLYSYGIIVTLALITAVNS